MKNIIQTIPAGKSEFNYEVRVNEELSLVLIAYESAQTNICVRLRGKGARAMITGIVLGSGDTKVLLHTMQIHEAPETTSDLLVKTVLRDESTCLYNGGIRVEKNAQRTNAYQRNENLLLSDRVYSESKPSLEILANDVRCTHGATAGPIDKEQLWYLASRGISKQSGEKLITQGFIASALARVADRSIMDKLWQTLFPS